jgi:hypothetical protein
MVTTIKRAALAFAALSFAPATHAEDAKARLKPHH